TVLGGGLSTIAKAWVCHVVVRPPDSQALQNDAPSQMEHIKAAIIEYLTQLKETARKTLDHLDGLNTLSTSKRNTLMKLSESFDKLHEYTQTASTSKQLCEKVMAGVENLCTKLKPKSEELQQVLQKHVEVYREKLKPIFKNCEDLSVREVSPHTADLQSKLEPYFEDLKSRFMTFYDTASTAMKA
uniref:Uncharacterized protein n=1 Tax=Oncorhynchus mykiss TaxID=8022 RepID=A0A8K9X2V6_ONCMY